MTSVVCRLVCLSVCLSPDVDRRRRSSAVLTNWASMGHRGGGFRIARARRYRCYNQVSRAFICTYLRRGRERQRLCHSYIQKKLMHVVGKANYKFKPAHTRNSVLLGQLRVTIGTEIADNYRLYAISPDRK